MLLRFDRLLPVSHYCATASTAYWQLPAERVTIIYNGVNLEQFAPDVQSGCNFREREGLRPPVALYVGRLTRQKGTDVLVEAARLLRERQSHVTVVAAGPLGQFHGGQSEERWDQLLVEAGGVYLGSVHDSSLPSVYNAARVFVMPTKHLEMFGMAVVEAQASGLPVIATAHGGLPETVGLENGGVLIPVDSATALAGAIEHACAIDATEQQGVSNRMFASRFDWERICTDLDTLYEALLSNPSPNHSPLNNSFHGA